MYRFSNQISKEENDAFVTKHPLCNLLQSSSWANIKQNWDSIYTGVYEENKLVATALVLVKRLPLGFTMFYIPRGPIMDFKNIELLKYYFKELKKLAKTYHCLFIKMDPGIHINDYKIEERNTEFYEDMKMYLDNFSEAGAIHKGFPETIAATIQPRFQANVYKSETFEEDLPRHTRRLIKDALKRDVEVCECGNEALNDFSYVVSLTEERKNVNLRNYDYFSLMMNAYGEDAKLFMAYVNIPSTLTKMRIKWEENEKEILACPENSKKKLRRLQDIKSSLEKDIKEFECFEKEYKDRTPISGVLSIKYGNTMEMLYAGMNDTFKKFMPQYYVYTENMKWAFENGCDFCNMGGVEGSLNDGLTKFKSNFNPMINEFIGEFDIPVNKLFYSLAIFAMNTRKKIMNRHA